MRHFLCLSALLLFAPLSHAADASVRVRVALAMALASHRPVVAVQQSSCSCGSFCACTNGPGGCNPTVCPTARNVTVSSVPQATYSAPVTYPQATVYYSAPPVQFQSQMPTYYAPPMQQYVPAPLQYSAPVTYSAPPVQYSAPYTQFQSFSGGGCPSGNCGRR